MNKQTKITRFPEIIAASFDERRSVLFEKAINGTIRKISNTRCVWYLREEFPCPLNSQPDLLVQKLV